MSDKKQSDVSGNYTAEASVALMTFVILFCLFYSYINSLMIQADIQNALNKAALDISGYCTTAVEIVDCAQPVMTKISEKAGNDPDNVAGLLLSKGLNIMSFLRGDRDTFDPGGAATDFIGSLKGNLSGGGNLPENCETAALDAIKSMASGLISDTTAGVVGHAIGGMMCRLTVPGYIGEDADKKLKAYGVENGVNGLNFLKSSVQLDGSDIVLCVEYTIKPFPGSILPIKYEVAQTAVAASYCKKGEYSSRSVWSYSNTVRGKKIVAKIKSQNLTTAIESGHVFDLYDSSDNEYTLVFSLNPFAKTYSTYSGLSGDEENSLDKFTLNTTAINKLLSTKANSLSAAIDKKSEGESVKRSYGGSVRLSKTNIKKHVIAVIPEEASVFLGELEKCAQTYTEISGVTFEFVRMDKLY